MPRLLLLVEDAPEAALIVQRLGRRMGLEVAHRPDVPSAWDWLRRGRPDLILLDLNLPGERGEELCRRLRAAPETSRLPVALFAHWGCRGDILAGLEAGADYVVSKDLLARPDAWQARLREILEPGNGLRAGHSLSWQRHDLLPPVAPEVVSALNSALGHPLLHQLGSDVVRFALRRAAGRAGGAAPGEDVSRWLRPDGLALDASRAAAAPTALVAFAVAVMDQMERLFGTEGSAPVRQGLGAAVGRPGG
jgi:CheY-like chemotaxis protein